MDNFKIQFYNFLSHLGDPALIFAAGAIIGLIVYLILSQVKKYFVFILTIVLIGAFALYMSGKKVSDIKDLNKKEIKAIGEKTKNELKKKVFENMPGLKWKKQ